MKEKNPPAEDDEGVEKVFPPLLLYTERQRSLQ